MPAEYDGFLILWAIVCIVVVLGMSYWVTRFVAGRGILGNGTGRMGNGQLKIVEQLMLGRDQRIVVVEVGEKHYLLGITANNISLLSEITWSPETGLDESIAQAAKERPTFREAFFDVLKQKKQR